MSAIKPMSAVFYPEYVKRLHGTHVKTGTTKADMVEALREDIRNFKKRQRRRRARRRVVRLDRDLPPARRGPPDRSPRFEEGLLENDPGIANSQIYAWACIKEGVPFANGAPNLTVDFPAAFELAKEHKVAHLPARTSRPARR